VVHAFRKKCLQLSPASTEQELNITKCCFAYKCCAEHSVLMTSPLITMDYGTPADASHNSLVRCEQSFVASAVAAARAVFNYTRLQG